MTKRAHRLSPHTHNTLAGAGNFSHARIPLAEASRIPPSRLRVPPPLKQMLREARQARAECREGVLKSYLCFKAGFPPQKVRLVPRWSATQRLTLTLGMLRSLRRTRIAGIRYSMNVLLVPVCCGQHVLPFPASGSPSAKQRFARAPKGELPRLYNRGLLKIGARGSWLPKTHGNCRAPPAREFREPHTVSHFILSLVNTQISLAILSALVAISGAE